MYSRISVLQLLINMHNFACMHKVTKHPTRMLHGSWKIKGFETRRISLWGWLTGDKDRKIPPSIKKSPSWLSLNIWEVQSKVMQKRIKIGITGTYTKGHILYLEAQKLYVASTAVIMRTTLKRSVNMKEKPEAVKIIKCGFTRECWRSHGLGKREVARPQKNKGRQTKAGTSKKTVQEDMSCGNCNNLALANWRIECRLKRTPSEYLNVTYVYILFLQGMIIYYVIACHYSIPITLKLSLSFDHVPKPQNSFSSGLKAYLFGLRQYSD